MQKRFQSSLTTNENNTTSHNNEIENSAIHPSPLYNEKLVSGVRNNAYPQNISSQAKFSGSMPSIPSSSNAGYIRPQGFQSMSVLNTNLPSAKEDSSNVYHVQERGYLHQQNLGGQPINYNHLPNTSTRQNMSRQYVKQPYQDAHNSRPSKLNSAQVPFDNENFYQIPETSTKAQFAAKPSPAYASNIKQSASLSALTDDTSGVVSSYSMYSIPHEVEGGQVLVSTQMKKSIARSQDSLDNLGLPNMDAPGDRKGEYIYQVGWFVANEDLNPAISFCTTITAYACNMFTTTLMYNCLTMHLL